MDVHDGKTANDQQLQSDLEHIEQIMMQFTQPIMFAKSPKVDLGPAGIFQDETPTVNPCMHHNSAADSCKLQLNNSLPAVPSPNPTNFKHVPVDTKHDVHVANINCQLIPISM